MLSFPVYTEAHPRRNAAHAAPSTFLFFSNSFRSYSFSTLSSLFASRVFTNSFEITQIRTLSENSRVYPNSSHSGSPRAVCAKGTLTSPSALTAPAVLSHVTGPPRASRGHLARVTYSFRINTCKSVSKQTTFIPFRMNTYDKHRGRGSVRLLTRNSQPPFTPEELQCRK